MTRPRGAVEYEPEHPVRAGGHHVGVAPHPGAAPVAVPVGGVGLDLAAPAAPEDVRDPVGPAWAAAVDQHRRPGRRRELGPRRRELQADGPDVGPPPRSAHQYPRPPRHPVQQLADHDRVPSPTAAHRLAGHLLLGDGPRYSAITTFPRPPRCAGRARAGRPAPTTGPRGPGWTWAPAPCDRSEVAVVTAEKPTDMSSGSGVFEQLGCAAVGQPGSSGGSGDAPLGSWPPTGGARYPAGHE